VTVQPGRWFVAAGHAGAAATRLVCLPWGGGNPLAYLEWQPDLAGVARVYAVRLPGRGPRDDEPSPPSIAALADAVAGAILADGADPVVLFGHSMGAVVAFEVARRLSDAPALRHLVVSGSAGPRDLPDDYLRWAASLDRQNLAAAAHRYEGLAREVVDSADLQDLLLPGLETDVRLLAGYEYTRATPLPCGLTLVNGRDDWHVQGTSLDSWALESTVAPQQIWLPGGHFYLTDAGSGLTAILRDLVATMAGVHVEVI
jgi:surfactin synthase thioesterase subunit